MSKGKAPIHKKRTPMHKQTATVITNKEPGFTYRVVNDKPGRIDQFLEGGYTFADDVDADDNRAQSESQMGTRKRMVVNRGNNAESTHAVVMKIPTEMYEEDQRAKQRDLDTAVAAFDPAGVKASGHSYDESKNIN